MGYKLALVVNGGLAACFVCLWVNHALHGDFWRADFMSFYLGAHIVRDRHGARLYDLDLQRDYQDRLVPERAAGGEGLLAFVNPPHAAVLLTPLAGLSREGAFFAWSALQFGLLLVLFRQLLADAADWSPGDRLLAVVTLLAFPPLFMTFQLGQWSLLGLVCLAGFYRGLERKRDSATAAWLVLGTVKPQLVVVPAVTLLACRRWRAAGLAGLLLAAWAGVTTRMLGWRIWLDFAQAVAHNAWQFGTFGIYPERMYNLKGLLTVLIGPERAELVNGLTTAAFVLAQAVTAVVWLRPGPPFELRAAVTLLLGLACNPHFNPADALTLVLPAWFHLLYLRRAGRPSHGWAVFLVSCPILFALDAWMLTDWPLRVRPFFFIMVGALAVMVRDYLRESYNKRRSVRV
jgi:hypothetical protein